MEVADRRYRYRYLYPSLTETAMANEARRLELMEWVKELEDDATLELLQVLKDSRNLTEDWFDVLSEDERSGIKRGLADTKAGRTVPHSQVHMKFIL
jgi:predicted transcriptional regulator